MVQSIIARLPVGQGRRSLPAGLQWLLPFLAATAGVLAPYATRADPQAASAEPVLVGTVTHVVDGDTINVRLGSGPVTVRLASIDAPEHDQPWGARATAALAQRLNGREVELEVQAQDQYDRLVAFVLLGGESLNAWQVQQGNAWAYRRYLSDPRFCAWEHDARTHGRGLWSATAGSPRAPWEWRRAQREGSKHAFTDYRDETVTSCVDAIPPRSVTQPPSVPRAGNESTAATSSRACLIKGNISENGKIYHLPGSEWYERTQIDPRRGERWFCTEAEARAAGWQPAR